MKILIINADDYGADIGRNEGIQEAVAAGIVRSVSLLANGAGTENALYAIRKGALQGVSVGLHLNLSEGKSLSEGLSILAGKNGVFRGKNMSHHLCMQEENLDLEKEIFRETEAQIRFLLDAGVILSHVDGHQHLHVFPAVRGVVLRAAVKYRIPWIRIPVESFPLVYEENLPKNLLSEGKLFSDLAEQTRSLLPGTMIRSTDHFLGLYLKGRLTTCLLEKYLEKLPNGLTELMVHPGRMRVENSPTPFSTFSTPDREVELSALLAPSFPGILERAGVRVSSYSEETP